MGRPIQGRQISGTQISRTLRWPISWQPTSSRRSKRTPSPTATKSRIDTELDELGIHSLELTEIVFDLEEAYGIEIEMNTVEAWSKLKNVGDIVEAFAR